MSDFHDSALLRELRELDPPKWLSWNLEWLIDKLSAEPSHGEHRPLLGECRRLYHEVQAWPSDLYPPQDADEMVARVAEIMAQVHAPGPGLKAPSGSQQAHRAEAKQAKKDSTAPQRPVSGVTASRGGRARLDEGPKRGVERRLNVVDSSRQIPSEAISPTPQKTSRGGEGAAPHLDVALLERHAAPDPRLVMLGQDHDEAERYRALYYRLSALGDPKVLLVTSAEQGMASPICAANLALAMAEGNPDPVLLLEAQFKHPSIARLFDFQPKGCVGQRLTRQRRSPDDAWPISELEEPSLHILAVDGNASSRPALDPRSLADVVDQLAATHYSHIVIDGPAVLDDNDAVFIAGAVDGVILTARAGQSRSRSIKRALKQLAMAPVVGFVFLED